jgi:hypothetical protein
MSFKLYSAKLEKARVGFGLRQQMGLRAASGDTISRVEAVSSIFREEHRISASLILFLYG